MKTQIRSLAAGAVLTAFATAPAAAQGIAAELTPQQSVSLSRIEAYLETLTTAEARFTQVTDAEGVARGTFYISRPGRMRIEYDPPIPYLYIANGTWLTFYDTELEQRTDVPVGSTLADFVVREDISFTDEVTVTAFHESADSFVVDVVQTDDPGAGTLTLTFQKLPMQLLRWRVMDAQGAMTDVFLDDARFGVPLDGDLFRIPRWD